MESELFRRFIGNLYFAKFSELLGEFIGANALKFQCLIQGFEIVGWCEV